MADNKHPRVIFCNDSPKRVLVSVIKTTPIKPRKAEDMTPTSPGFSDFMVYPWKWGENAHNVTLSPGSASGASSPTGTQTAREADTAPSPDQIRVGSINCIFSVWNDTFFCILTNYQFVLELFELGNKSAKLAAISTDL